MASSFWAFWPKNYHSRPQSRVPFGQRHGTKALAGTNLKSANRGLPVVLRRLGADPKWLTKCCWLLVLLAWKFLVWPTVDWKGKQYEVLKCVVLDNNDVLAVLETIKSLIYQLVPPVFALISWHLEETHREEVYCVHCCSYFAAQCTRSWPNSQNMCYKGIVGPRKKMSTAWSVPIGQCSPRKSST